MNNFIAKRRGLLLILLAAAQTVVLSVLLVSHYAVSWYGRDIELRTKPIDPTDLFYGDYVSLNYEISQLPGSMWKSEGEPKAKESVYVLLAPSVSDPTLYEALGAYPKKPAAGPDQVVLKARVNYAGDTQISLRYGLERYYLPQGTGKAFEDRRTLKRVRITIAPWGQAVVKDLTVEP